MKIKKISMILLSTLILTLGMSMTVYAAEKPVQYDNVVMVYMVGSDLETDDACGVLDIEEMASSQIGEHNLVVVQTGGAKKWHSANGQKIKSDKLQRYTIKDGRIELIETLDNDSMGKAEVLTDFVKFTQETYSAKTSSLVLWSHGAGPVYGFGQDDNFEDILTLEELNDALDEVNYLESITFDACLMGSIETAYALAEHANFMLSSSEIAPADGIDYKSYLEMVTSQPMDEMTKEDLKAITMDNHATLSIVDLSKVTTLMHSVSDLILRSSPEDIFDAALNSLTFGADEGSKEYYDLFDLKGILSNLPNSEQALAELDEVIVSNYTCNSYKESSGLSIYLPITDDYFSPDEAAISMDDLNFPKGYLPKILDLKSFADPNAKLTLPNFEADFEDEWSDVEKDNYEGQWEGLDSENYIESWENSAQTDYERASMIQLIIDYLRQLLYVEYPNYGTI